MHNIKKWRVLLLQINMHGFSDLKKKTHLNVLDVYIPEQDRSLILEICTYLEPFLISLFFFIMGHQRQNRVSWVGIFLCLTHTSGRI